MKALSCAAAAFALAGILACGGDEVWEEPEEAAGKADESSSGRRNPVTRIQNAMLTRALPGGCSVKGWRAGLKRVDFFPTESYAFCASIEQGGEAYPEFCISAWPGPDDVQTRGKVTRYHYYIGDKFSNEVIDVEIDLSTGAVVHLHNTISNYFGAQKLRYAECGASRF